MSARALAPALVLVWGCWSAGLAGAQEPNAVYRCGDGQYRQTPCPGGTRLAAGAGPTAEQQREAQQTAERERRLAEQLRRERHAREAAATPAMPARIGPPPLAASKPGKGASAAHDHRKKRKQHRDGVKSEPDSRRAYAPKPKP